MSGFELSTEHRLERRVASQDLWKGAALVLALALLMVVWNGTLPAQTFMGDDLSFVLTAQSGEFPAAGWPVFTYVIAGRYRPVAIMALALAFQWFGTEFRWYLYLNWVLQFANVLLVSWLAFQLSGRRWHVAWAAGLAVIVSRFAYYFTLQVIGLLEVIALFLMLLMIATLVRAYKRQLTSMLGASIICYFLLLFTHERFIVVGGFLCLAIFFWPGVFRPTSRRWLWSATPLLAPVSTYLVKVHVLHAPMFVGTGGASAEFNPALFFPFLWAGIQNLVGFNAGPAYLSGLHWRQAGALGGALGVSLLASVVALVVANLARAAAIGPRALVRTEWRNMVLFAALLGPLLIAASITIRQEFRWLMAPDVVFLLALAYLYGRTVRLPGVRLLVGPLILLAILAVDTFYRTYLDNVFFMYSLRVSDAAKMRVVDNYGAELTRRQVYVVATDPNIRQWVLQGDQFFRLYARREISPVHYVASIRDVPVDPAQLDDILVFEATHAGVRDVTAIARGFLRSRAPAMHFDFVEEFATGLISDTRAVATPNRQGAFIMVWPSGPATVTGLTVVSSFRYRYDHIEVRAGDALFVTAAMPYPKGDGAQAYVEVAAPSGTRRLASLDLPAAPAEGGFLWRSFRVPLQEYAGNVVSFTVGVESPSGDQTADWVVFRDLYLGSSDNRGSMDGLRPASR